MEWRTAQLEQNMKYYEKWAEQLIEERGWDADYDIQDIKKKDGTNEGK